MQEDITVKTEELEEVKEKKPKKKKKEIPKKEKVFKGFWIFFLVIFIIMCLFRFGFPLLLRSDNPKVLKSLVVVAVKLMDDTVEYTTEDGQTRNYHLTMDYSYFEFKDGKPPISTPFIIDREEKDGTMTRLDKKEVIADDKLYGDEKTAVVMQFLNTATKKIGFDIVKEYYSGDDTKDKFNITKGQRIATDIFIIYIIFFIIFSILTYYQIWSRHYDENLEKEKLIQELNKEYQKGMTKEQANQRQAPKKLTKKQKRELNKQNRQ